MSIPLSNSWDPLSPAGDFVVTFREKNSRGDSQIFRGKRALFDGRRQGPMAFSGESWSWKLSDRKRQAEKPVLSDLGSCAYIKLRYVQRTVRDVTGWNRLAFDGTCNEWPYFWTQAASIFYPGQELSQEGTECMAIRFGKKLNIIDLIGGTPSS